VGGPGGIPAVGGRRRGGCPAPAIAGEPPAPGPGASRGRQGGACRAAARFV